MGADLNPYAYVGGDVLGSVDPLGLQGVSAGGGARYEGGVLHMPAVNIHARPPRALTAKPVVIVAPRPALAPQSHGHAVNGQLPLEKALRAFRIFGGFMAADAVDLGSKLAQPGAFVTGQGVARGAVSAASPAAGAVINHVAPAPNPKDAGPEVGSFGVNYVLPAVTGAVGARGAGATAPRTSGAAGGGVVRGINRFGGVVSSSANPAGGLVVTAEGPVQGMDFAGHVNGGLIRGGPVNILSGVHGTEAGVMSADAAILQEDISMFGGIDGVTVHNTATLSASEISAMLRGPGTTIGAFCNSGICLAPFR